MSRIAFALCAASILLVLACDDGRPDISTVGLHADCPEAGCVEGQQCVTAPGPGGDSRTCEIVCAADGDCPEPLVCNLPPVLPDSIPNVCVAPHAR